jgi:hypothetical protein
MRQAHTRQQFMPVLAIEAARIEAAMRSPGGRLERLAVSSLASLTNAIAHMA